MQMNVSMREATIVYLCAYQALLMRKRLVKMKKIYIILILNFKKGGVKMYRKTFCPVEDFFCPYCTDKGECLITNPEQNCDDYYYYYDSEEEEITEAV